MSKEERTATLTDEEKACLKKACSFPVFKRCSCGKEFRCTGECPFSVPLLKGLHIPPISSDCFCKECLLREIGSQGGYVKERLKCYLD